MKGGIRRNHVQLVRYFRESCLDAAFEAECAPNQTTPSHPEAVIHLKGSKVGSGRDYAFAVRLDKRRGSAAVAHMTGGTRTFAAVGSKVCSTRPKPKLPGLSCRFGAYRRWGRSSGDEPGVVSQEGAGLQAKRRQRTKPISEPIKGLFRPVARLPGNSPFL